MRFFTFMPVKEKVYYISTACSTFLILCRSHTHGRSTLNERDVANTKYINAIFGCRGKEGE